MEERKRTTHSTDTGNEDRLLASVLLEKLLSRLDPEEERIVRDELEGRREFAASDQTLREVIRKMAIISNVYRYCDGCQRDLPAADYGWNTYRLETPRGRWHGLKCFACEGGSLRSKRAQIERYNQHVREGAVWECRTCGQQKPASTFAMHNRSRCRDCGNERGREQARLKRLKADVAVETEQASSELAREAVQRQSDEDRERWVREHYQRLDELRAQGQVINAPATADPIPREPRNVATKKDTVVEPRTASGEKAERQRPERKEQRGPAEPEPRVTPQPRQPARCGTVYKYRVYGCRCGLCVEVYRKYERDKSAAQRARERGEATRKLRPAPACGTYSKYVKGCRCPDCTQSKREYQRQSRKKAAVNNVS